MRSHQTAALSANVLRQIKAQASEAETITLPSEAALSLVRSVEGRQLPTPALPTSEDQAEILTEILEEMEELLQEHPDTGPLAMRATRYRLALEMMAGEGCSRIKVQSIDCRTLNPNSPSKWCCECLAEHTLAQDSLFAGLEGDEG